MTNKTGHFGFATVVARTDVGRKRKNNEDAFGVYHEAGVFCVADGMGGGDDGEIASAAVVKGLEDDLKALAVQPDGAYAVADVADVVESSLTRASAWIFNRTRTKKLTGCGSTFVGFALDATAPGGALAIHAGDSRLYLLHGRGIKQITHDHSVAEMIGAKDESKVNPMFRSMVMNAIGIRAKADPERTPFKVAAGDRILVCSDGLSRMVPDKKILAISRKYEDVGVAADALIAAALEAGGIDNVTVVLVEVGELPAALPALSPPPIPETGDDAATESAERDTGLTGGGTTDGSQTMSTLAPAMSGEAMLAPEETEDAPIGEMGSEPSLAVAPTRRRRLPLMIALAIGIALIVAGALRFLSRETPSPVQPEPSPVRFEPLPVQPESATVQPEPATEAAVSKVVPEPRTEVEPVPSPGPVPVQEKKEEPPSKAETAPELPPEPLPVKPVAEVPVLKPPVTPTVIQPTNVVSHGAEAFEEVVRACDGNSLAQFGQALRRLEGADNHDLTAQMKRFEASVHFCARMRTKEGVERVVVDLKYCLVAAGRARKALATNNKALARRLIVWWDALQEGEPTSTNTMMAAARFMKGLAELECR